MSGTSPVRRRLLGAVLRKYRENLGYDLAVPARILDCDRSKISRIETGQRGIRRKELRELLTEYGVPEAEQAALQVIAHRAPQHGWWHEYPDMLSGAAEEYVIMEAAAAEILAYEPHQIPDLLQTADYARAVAGADPGCGSEEQRGHAAEVTLARQRDVLGRERRPRLDVVVGEGALHHAVGGPGVTRAQLARLAAIADGGAAGVSLRVLPFTAGAYTAAGYGAMTILRFADVPCLSVIHLAGLAGGVTLEDQDDVARYVKAFAQLRTGALTPAASARLLRDMACC